MEAWIAAALEKPTHMAASLDLTGAAHLLLDVGLARIQARVLTMRGLARLDRVADLTTLKGIARLLLVHRPPDWLRSAVIDERLASEFIPQDDLAAIEWLGDDLEPIIVDVHRQLYGVADERMRKLLGDAGELAVMSALRLQGRDPRHVALVSDRFGYDIELQANGGRHGVEVKTAVTNSAGRILVSRNEFEVAKRMGQRWKIVQVTFSSRVIARGQATAVDIETIRELSSEMLVNLAPVEPDTFRWAESGEFRPTEGAWSASDLVVADEFETSLC